jgi:hypothetical protein
MELQAITEVKYMRENQVYYATTDNGIKVLICDRNGDGKIEEGPDQIFAFPESDNFNPNWELRYLGQDNLFRLFGKDASELVSDFRSNLDIELSNAAKKVRNSPKRTISFPFSTLQCGKRGDGFEKTGNDVVVRDYLGDHNADSVNFTTSQGVKVLISSLFWPSEQSCPQLDPKHESIRWFLKIFNDDKSILNICLNLAKKINQSVKNGEDKYKVQVFIDHSDFAYGLFCKVTITDKETGKEVLSFITNIYSGVTHVKCEGYDFINLTEPALKGLENTKKIRKQLDRIYTDK